MFSFSRNPGMGYGSAIAAAEGRKYRAGHNPRRRSSRQFGVTAIRTQEQLFRALRRETQQQRKADAKLAAEGRIGSGQMRLFNPAVSDLFPLLLIGGLVLWAISATRPRPAPPGYYWTQDWGGNWILAPDGVMF